MVRSVEPSVSHKRLEGFFFCMLFGQQFARPKDRGLSSRRVFGPLSKGGTHANGAMTKVMGASWQLARPFLLLCLLAAVLSMPLAIKGSQMYRGP